MPWNGLVGQHMQGRVCLQSWPLLGPFGRLLADFLRYSYYNRTITVLSYENRTFPYYNRTTTLRTNPVRPHATGPYQPRTTKARFLRNCPLWGKPGFVTAQVFFLGGDPGTNPGGSWCCVSWLCSWGLFSQVYPGLGASFTFTSPAGNSLGVVRLLSSLRPARDGRGECSQGTSGGGCLG